MIDIKTADPSLLPITETGTAQGAERKSTTTKNFQQIYAELFGPEQAKLQAQLSVDLKLKDKDSASKVKTDLDTDKTRDKKKVDVDASAVLALMLQHLQALANNKDIMALNNKQLLSDINAMIVQIQAQQTSAGSDAGSSSASTRGATGKTGSHQAIDPKLLQAFKDLAQKYPGATETLNKAQLAVMAELATLAKPVRLAEGTSATIESATTRMSQLQSPPLGLSPENLKVSRATESTKLSELSNGGAGDKKSASTDVAGVTKVVVKVEEKPTDNKLLYNLLGGTNSQMTGSQVSLESNRDVSTFRQNILDQIDSVVKLQVNAPQNEVRIRLNPPSLGEVIIKLQMMDDKTQPGKQILVSNMVVESESVKDALMSGVTQLKQTMQDNSGVNLKDFNVMVRTQQEFNPQQRQQESTRAHIKKRGLWGGLDEDEDPVNGLSSVMKELDGLFEYVA